MDPKSIWDEDEVADDGVDDDESDPRKRPECVLSRDIDASSWLCLVVTPPHLLAHRVWHLILPSRRVTVVQCSLPSSCMVLCRFSSRVFIFTCNDTGRSGKR